MISSSCTPRFSRELSGSFAGATLAALLGLACATPVEPAPPAPPVLSAKQVAGPTARSARCDSALPGTPRGALEAPLPLAVVLDQEEELRLHDLGDRAFVSTRQRLFAIDGAELSMDASLVVGLPKPGGFWGVGHVAGRWPDAAWLNLIEPLTYAARSVVYRWEGKRWQRVQALEGVNTIDEIAPWSSDRLLGVVQSSYAFDPSFRSLPMRGGATLPQFTKAKRAFSACIKRLRAQALATLPSGHVFVGGSVCETSTDDFWVVGAGVERWEPGSRHGTLDVLPGAALSPQVDVGSLTSLAAVSPTELYASVETVPRSAPTVRQLFRYDGSRWTIVPTGISSGVARVWLGEGRALWASDGDGQLWRRNGDGSWTTLPLPAAVRGGKHTSFWQRDRHVWLVVEQHTGGATLLHGLLD